MFLEMLKFFQKKSNDTANPASEPAQATVSPALSASPVSLAPSASPTVSASNSFAEIALNNIHDGVIVTNASGVIEFINPAAVTMTDCQSRDNAVGLDYTLLIKLESKEGRPLTQEENPLTRAFAAGQPLESFATTLVSGASAKRIPISITLLPLDTGERLITFRNIEKELAEESEQAEFVSTASHEMRTPVATIDGYVSLALNPATATIDDRARGYLESAEKASKHLGKLFQDLLDVTKLDDGRIRPELRPVEMFELVKQITSGHLVRANEVKVQLYYGSAQTDGAHRLEQVLYASVDPNFLQEVLDNVIDNAIKYTPEGGQVIVNTTGDSGHVIVSVKDTGIGISSTDLQHIFQKFYRADNSDTREIGGTGLGLYIAKERTEAMGGRIWAESAVGAGTTFYISLPRLSAEEYQKRLIAVSNADMINNSEGGTNE